MGFNLAGKDKLSFYVESLQIDDGHIEVPYNTKQGKTIMFCCCHLAHVGATLIIIRIRVSNLNTFLSPIDRASHQKCTTNFTSTIET